VLEDRDNHLIDALRYAVEGAPGAECEAAGNRASHHPRDGNGVQQEVSVEDSFTKIEPARYPLSCRCA
jgi:hypothetical protein